MSKCYLGWHVENGKVWPYRVHVDCLQTSTGKFRIEPSLLVELTPEQETMPLTDLDEKFKDHPKRPHIQDIPK